jgi:hypothetical protein
MFPFPPTYTYEETVRRTVTVYDIYGDEIPAPPKGKRYVAFRPPLPNDEYLPVEGGRCLGPRLILGDAPKRRYLKVPLDCDSFEIVVPWSSFPFRVYGCQVLGGTVFEEGGAA